MPDFNFPIRVYYEDTDSGGVVYHSQYLNFMERARTEWLRILGFEQDTLRDEHKCIFVVKRIEIDFIKPARFNDALIVSVQLKEAAFASLYLIQSIINQKTNEILCKAEVKIAAVYPDTFKPRRIPELILAGIKA
jgi:acyl-CoA thioester hydrolase